MMWDNRCLVHAATGGYDDHQRLLHRITVAEPATLAVVWRRAARVSRLDSSLAAA